MYRGSYSTITQIRKYIVAYYDGNKGWARKVSKMSDGQVLAIYYRLKLKERPTKELGKTHVQLTIDDILKGDGNG